MKAFLGCDIGKCRTENQDTIRAMQFRDGVFAIVCDGMGGMQDGAVASKIAAAAAEERFSAEYSETMTPEEICELLQQSAAEANQKVYQTACRNRLYSRMGTTLVAAYVRDDTLCLVNIGDSRAYLSSADGSFSQLTTDHTVVQLLYEQGVIRAEERATHARRNELMRAVGVSSRVLSDTGIIPLCPGDRVMLCSDGLYGMIPEKRLAELTRQSKPEQYPEICVDEANANGGADNISVILIANE
ncbi:MAG: protein phosphatase 2C domain-containing protein [Oscillospiraceae bacterium]|nr:protein phosphatase 2C domain-containing protein [Oscillospiraceae bacterium]